MLRCWVLSVSPSVTGLWEGYKGNAWESGCVGAVWHSGDRSPARSAIPTVLPAPPAFGPQEQNLAHPAPSSPDPGPPGKTLVGSVSHKGLCCGLSRWC